ncbi:MAG: hypothetical protein ACTSPY_02560 [Candidatus Helarchaeota archaeon]
MDIFTDLIISNWHIIIAITATLLVLWLFLKKPNNDSSSALNSLIVKKVSNNSNIEFSKYFDDKHIHSNIIEFEKDLELVQKLSRELEGVLTIDTNHDILIPAMNYYQMPRKNYLNLKSLIALIWIAFWAGFMAFIITRMCFYIYIYSNDGIIIGWFIYYIFLGLIVFFRKR